MLPCVRYRSHFPACSQLAQLDVAIRDHKQEMERKVEFLEKSLEARERELRDAQREHSDRNMKVRTHREGTNMRKYIFVCALKQHCRGSLIKMSVLCQQQLGVAKVEEGIN